MYDYNIMRSDVFRDHVGEVTAYVFDAENQLLAVKTEDSPTLLGTYGYEMVFDDLKPGHYRVAAVAFQRNADGREERPGAKFRGPELTLGDPIEELQVKLDRQPMPDGTTQVEHLSVALDTLWMNYEAHPVEIIDQQITQETIGLMRDTKNLTVSLRQIDQPTDIDCQDFDIRITDRNGWFGPDNQPLADDLLTYTPYAAWNTEFNDDEGVVVQRAAHADLSYPRIMYHEDWRKNARLTIFNKRTQTMVADINLPDILAQGRNSQELQYSPQEFLDREHTYKLDFFLKGDTWDYVELRISVLSWAVRIDNVNL
ncbi:protein containing DUF1812 [gut metagenome]|uniref:Protein containing DUF1812 n=1 Tax=gut metagenome TaxID=749906 RepID=J9D7W2_9ZZZZ